MKIFKIIISTFYLQCCLIVLHGQTINWKCLDSSQHHLLNANIGIDYSINYELGYAYKLNTKLPILLQTTFSYPSGTLKFDDFKNKIGAQVNFFEYRNFRASMKLMGIFRRYQTRFVRLVNFGSDFSVNFGYYRPKYFFVLDCGLDKAIVTHFKHSGLYKESFPNVVDGWYEPATGGCYHYGVQTGLSFKKQDIYITAGKLLYQDFRTKPLFPFYTQIGYNFRF